VTDGPPTGDGGGIADGALEGASDAGAPGCRLDADWGAPTPVAELNALATSAEFMGVTDVSPDLLTAYVNSNHGVAGLRAFFATRSSAARPLGALAPLLAPAEASSWDDWGVSLTSDGLTALVSSDRNGHDDDLYLSTRASTTAAFSVMVGVVPWNTPSNEGTPRFSADGNTAYFDSDRTGDRELYAASSAGGTFGAPTHIAELGSPALEASPVLSADELTIYFLSARPPATDGDIWMATRPSKTSSWGPPSQVISLSSAAFDGPGALSRDGCTFYINSARDSSNGAWHTYVARRQ
jgi:hypothetical protein